MPLTDEEYMHIALAEAAQAAAEDEVPIGAIVVLNGEIKGRGHNRVIQLHDPTAHAEILAIREAAQTIGNYRLLDATLYSTIEPCAMCAGAVIHARIGRLVYGAADEKAGAVTTHFQICTTNFLNHRTEILGAILEPECREMIQSFFRRKREKLPQLDAE